jgi:hypothetical protein
MRCGELSKIASSNKLLMIFVFLNVLNKSIEL